MDLAQLFEREGGDWKVYWHSSGHKFSPLRYSFQLEFYPGKSSDGLQLEILRATYRNSCGGVYDVCGLVRFWQ